MDIRYRGDDRKFCLVLFAWLWREVAQSIYGKADLLEGTRPCDCSNHGDHRHHARVPKVLVC